MMQKTRLKKIQLLPNVITAFGLACGLFAIFKVNMTGVGEMTQQNLMAITGILLIAALADLLDGAVARVIKAESEFGGIFDSLADAISFGVAPSVIILKSLSLMPGTKLSLLATIAGIIFSLCGVLRLARFNILASEAKTNMELALANKSTFTGLPITAAAPAAISLNLFLFSDDLKSLTSLSDTAHTWILSIALILLGYCMISRWKFPSVKNLNLHVRVRSFQVVLWIVICSVLLLYGFLHHFSTTFFVLAWGYVILAWIFSIIRMIAGKKSKTLEEFEPEPDEESEE